MYKNLHIFRIRKNTLNHEYFTKIKLGPNLTPTRSGEAWVNLNLNKPLEQNPVTTNKFNANIFSSVLMLSTWSKDLRKTQLDHYQTSKVKWLLELVNLYTSFHIYNFHHSGSNHHYLLSRLQSGLSATMQSSLVHSPSE